MANPYPAVVEDLGKSVRIDGFIDFNDPANQPSAGPPFKPATGDDLVILTDSTGAHDLIGGGDDLGGASITSTDATAVVNAVSGSANVTASGGAINLSGGGSGNLNIGTTGDTVGFLGATPAAIQTITGALSTVADAPAKDVLTSIITALVNYGLAINGTT